MDLTQLRICRECRPSIHRALKHAKNAVLENEANQPVQLSTKESGILNDYIFKNTVKKPEHLGMIGRMALETSKIWKNGRRITIGFIGGSKIVRARVQEHAAHWMDFANLEFDFKARKNKVPDIRISFRKNDGSWSYTGTEVLAIDARDPTMNFGWFTDTSDDEDFRRTVLHEFGHSLGCIHEHSSPIGGVPWDKAKAYKYYQETQDWTKEEVNEQLFAKYYVDLIRGTKVDKKSIMMYPIPNGITIGDYEVGWNNTLSRNDKIFIGRMYPKK